MNLGRYEEARAFAEQAVALARPGTIAASAARIALAHVMSDQGDGEAALAMLDAVREEAERNEPDRRVIYWSYRAQTLLGLNRLDEAWRSATQAVELTVATPGMGMTAFLNAAEVAEARRDLDGIDALSTRFDEYFAGRDTAPIRLVRLEIGAIRALCTGLDAASAFDEIARTYETLGARVRATYRGASAELARMRDPRGRAKARRELSSRIKELEVRRAPLRCGPQPAAATPDDRARDRRSAQPPPAAHRATHLAWLDRPAYRPCRRRVRSHRWHAGALGPQRPGHFDAIADRGVGRGSPGCPEIHRWSCALTRALHIAEASVVLDAAGEELGARPCGLEPADLFDEGIHLGMRLRVPHVLRGVDEDNNDLALGGRLVGSPWLVFHDADRLDR